MNCLNCAHLTTKPRSPDQKQSQAIAVMARQTFGTCLKQPAYVFMSPTHERECKMFEPAPEAQMAARLKWAAA